MCHGIVVACEKGLHKNQLKRAVQLKERKKGIFVGSPYTTMGHGNQLGHPCERTGAFNECKVASETGNKLFYTTLCK